MSKEHLLRLLMQAVITGFEDDDSCAGEEARERAVGRAQTMLTAYEAVQRWMPDGAEVI